MKSKKLIKGSPTTFNQKKGNRPIKQLNSTRYYNLTGLAVIILLGILIYSNSFNCSFHFDDFANIVDNPKIRDISDVNAWWNFVPSRPLGNLTFALNYHFNKLDVRYYHLVNLFIHLINALLVWWFTILIFSCPAVKETPVIRYKNRVAFFTALLFVSHPLATQSVTYIVQRLASMAAMFYLLSLCFYLKARLTDKNDTTKYLLFAGSFLSALIAMLTKENAFTLPFAIVLSELFFFRTRRLSLNLRDGRIIILFATFLGIAILISLNFSFSVFKPIPPTQGHAYTVTPHNYLFTQFSVIIKYIQLLFVPVNQRLDYDFPISDNFFAIRTLLSLLADLSLLFLAFFLYNKNRILSFGIFWFFLTLSIESGIIPLPNVIFEHRTYLPSVGFFLFFCTGVFVISGEKYKQYAISILMITALAYSYMTFSRNKIWKDNLVLWNDNVSKAPHLARPLLNRGFSYAILGQWDRAIEDYSKAILLNPGYPEAWFNRAAAYGKTGQWDLSIRDYSRAIDLHSDFTDAFIDRGANFQNLRRFSEAKKDFQKAMKIDYKDVRAYQNLGMVYFIQNNFDSAIDISLKGLCYNPGDASLYDNLGYFYMEKGDYDKAVEYFQKCLKIKINHFDAILGLAMDYFYKNDKVMAGIYLAKAKIYEPRLKEAMAGIAELEKSDYSYTAKEKITLTKMFEELK